MLVERGGDDALDIATLGELDRSIDGLTGESAGTGLGCAGRPLADRDVYLGARTPRTDDDEVRRGADAFIAPRRLDDLRADATWVAE